MSLWRLHLMPTGGQAGTREDQALRAQELCRERSVLGMGWSVDADLDENLSWDEYRARSIRVDGSVRRWNEDVENNCLLLFQLKIALDLLVLYQFPYPAQRQEARSEKSIHSRASPLNFILITSYDTATSICRGFAASDLGTVRVKIPSL